MYTYKILEENNNCLKCIPYIFLPSALRISGEGGHGQLSPKVVRFYTIYEYD